MSHSHASFGTKRMPWRKPIPGTLPKSFGAFTSRSTSLKNYSACAGASKITTRAASSNAGGGPAMLLDAAQACTLYNALVCFHDFTTHVTSRPTPEGSEYQF